MEKEAKQFWEALIKEYAINSEGQIMKGIFAGKSMKQVYDYFINKAYDYPSMLIFFESDLNNLDIDFAGDASMHPIANKYEKLWGCDMEFST